jgi:Effector Associated Constant Component 1
MGRGEHYIPLESTPPSAEGSGGSDCYTRRILFSAHEGFIFVRRLILKSLEKLEIKVSSPDLDDSRVQALTGELVKSLRDQNLGNAALASGESRPGKKGDPVTVGNIILTLIGSGGVAVSLVHVLRAYVERKSTLRFEVTRADGDKRVLDATNLGKGQLEATQQMLTEFLRD